MYYGINKHMEIGLARGMAELSFYLSPYMNGGLEFEN